MVSDYTLRKPSVVPIQMNWQGDEASPPPVFSPLQKGQEISQQKHIHKILILLLTIFTVHLQKAVPKKGRGRAWETSSFLCVA